MPSEALFTAPSDWCPEPRRWAALDGDAAECEVSDLVGALVVALKPKVVVETGTHLGGTASRIVGALRYNQFGHLWTIENDPDMARHAARGIEGEWATVVCGWSLEWTPPDGIGFAWLDSDIVCRPWELRRYWARFAPGAIVGVHDTAPHHLDRAGWDALVAGLPALNLRTPRGVTFLQLPY